jgi:hypothetical protein
LRGRGISLNEHAETVCQRDAYIEVQNAHGVRPVKEKGEIDGGGNQTPEARIWRRTLECALLCRGKCAEGDQQGRYHQKAQDMQCLPEVVGEDPFEKTPFFEKESEAQRGEGEMKNPFIPFYETAKRQS